MNGVMRSLSLLTILLVCLVDAAPKPKKLKQEKTAAPPAPPPVLVPKEKSSAGIVAMSTLLPADQYSIGSPTDEEQLFVEYINRARADAIAESVRLANTTDPDVVSAIASWVVDLPQMLSQFTVLEQHLPPLSINSILTDVSRLHTQDMFDNAFQGHISSSSPPAPFNSGDELSDRVDHFPAYNYTALAENVYSNSRSVFYGHAGFEIDWGAGPYGMQDPPGHRYNIHQYAEPPDPPFEFREIGVGVVLGTNTVDSSTVGPMLVTQNFGNQDSPVPFITGVE